MRSILEIVEEANHEIDRSLSKALRACGEKQCGLDERAGTVWVTEEAVIIRADRRQRLEYYGGFEYVSPEAKLVVGEFAIYLANEDSTGRVQEVIDRVHDRFEEEE